MMLPKETSGTTDEVQSFSRRRPILFHLPQVFDGDWIWSANASRQTRMRLSELRSEALMACPV
jgi:hypothetical protein